MVIKKDSVIIPLPDDLLIEEREKKWRIKLPMSYKNFIEKYNGGIPQENTIDLDGQKYIITRFLGIIKDITLNDLGWYDIGAVESQIGERLTDNMDLIGMEVVPIAELFGGNYVCLDFRETKECANICIWFHDESDEFSPVTKKIANDFDEFLKMLK